MKKVVLFTDCLGSGGAQRQVVNIACLLKKAGYDVRVLVYRDVPFYKGILDENQIPLICIETKSNLSRMLSIRRWLRKCGADVVISFLETPCFISCFANIGRKKWKLITTERSAKMSTFTSRKNRIYNWFERFSDVKVGNSQNAMNMWRKYYPQYSDKYSVIYNYVSVPDEYVNAEHQFCSDGKVHIVVAASYQELKNPIRVIEAINMLDDDLKKRLVLDWYGNIEATKNNTEVYDKSVELVHTYRLEECVHLNRDTNEIYRHMSKSDAVALFSTVEGLPNAICEAMIMGKPIIMSKVSDYDVLVDGNGFLCDPWDVNSIKCAIKKILISSEAQRKEMGEESQKKAECLFSVSEIQKKWARLIEIL